MDPEQRNQRDNASASSFYEQLFRAMEFDTAKADSGIEQLLLDEFGVPEGSPPIQWLTQHFAPEEVLGWLLDRLPPFARMLLDLYDWLADIRSTISGNMREVSFDFHGLSESVSFSLDAFPKTYVQRWAASRAFEHGFEPAARGRLRIDTPNYWNDNVAVLRNLSASVALHPDVFENLPVSNQAAIFRGVLDVLHRLEEKYVRKVLPEALSSRIGGDRVVYVADEAEWEATLDQLGRSDSDWAGLQLLNAPLDAGRFVDGAAFEQLSAHIDSERARDLVGAEGEPVFAEDRESDDTYALLTALHLCLSEIEVDNEALIDMVDKVLLPFWRHRWRLFEVWAILWTINTIPEEIRPFPVLVPRDDLPDTYSWVLPGGDAAHPVAVSGQDSGGLTIWFQMKTPLSAADAATFGQGNIEPDIRIRRMPDDADHVILELKDRHRAPGTEEKRIGRMYSTTGAKLVVVGNYSLFRSRTLRGQVYTEARDSSTIYIVDDFKPGAIPAELAEAVRDAVSPEPIDVLVDVSASIDAGRLRATLMDLPISKGARWFTWTEHLDEAANRDDVLNTSLHGPTDLPAALGDYQRRQIRRRAIIVTDDDGVGQFESMAEAGSVERLLYVCVDITSDAWLPDLQEWISRRGHDSGE